VCCTIDCSNKTLLMYPCILHGLRLLSSLFFFSFFLSSPTPPHSLFTRVQLSNNKKTQKCQTHSSAPPPPPVRQTNPIPKHQRRNGYESQNIRSHIVLSESNHHHQNHHTPRHGIHSHRSPNISVHNPDVSVESIKGERV